MDKSSSLINTMDVLTAAPAPAPAPAPAVVVLVAMFCSDCKRMVL
jgi:hypothetical protein